MTLFYSTHIGFAISRKQVEHVSLETPTPIKMNSTSLSSRIIIAQLLLSTLLSTTLTGKNRRWKLSSMPHLWNWTCSSRRHLHPCPRACPGNRRFPSPAASCRRCLTLCSNHRARQDANHYQRRHHLHSSRSFCRRKQFDKHLRTPNMAKRTLEVVSEISIWKT